MPTELLDSAIVIDHMNGIAAATAYIERVESPGISVVTWIEVMAGFRDARSEALGRRVLASFELAPISEAIAEEAVRVRRGSRIKLADALILATARHLGCPLVTRNTKDFQTSDPGIVVPYRI